MRRLKASYLVIVLGLLIMLPSPVFAPPSEVLDQVNDPSPTSFFIPALFPGCMSLYQGFTPTLPILTQVDVRLANLATTPSNQVIRIIEGDPNGAVLFEGTYAIQVAAKPGFLLLVDLGPGIAVTPGNTYVIQVEWLQGDGTYWAAVGADVYSGGVAYSCDGNPTTAPMEFNFRTWGPAQATGVPEFGAPLILVTSVALVAFVAYRNRFQLARKI